MVLYLQIISLYPDSYNETLQLELPEGAYVIHFVEPATGKDIRVEQVIGKGENIILNLPEYTIDIVLRIDAVDSLI